MKISAHKWMSVLGITIIWINVCLTVKINSDGGYEDIVVAISPAMTQDNRLIDKIKIMLQKTSQKLYASSNATFYFKSAIISLPSIWSTDPSVNTINGYHIHKDGDVRVVPNNFMNYEITTQQPRGCGKPGDFIQINNKFYDLSMEDQTHLFLQNWLRYRFGVYGESWIQGSKLFPPYYPRKYEWKVTGCEHPYSWITPGCPSERNPKDCVFLPEGRITSSVMSENKQATEFCTSGEENTHNREAPTPQNAYCQQKSIWEVIKESNDYGLVHSHMWSLPQIQIDVRKSAGLLTILMIDPELCRPDTKDVVFPSVSKAMNDFFKPTMMAVIMADEIVLGTMIININVRFINQVLNSACTIYIRRPDKKHIAKAFAQTTMILQQHHINYKAANVIFLAHANSNYDTELENFLEQFNSNLRFNLVHYPTRQRKLPDTFLDKNFVSYNIPIDQMKSMVNPKCDLHAKIKFDQVFQTIFGHFEDNFYTKTTMITEPIVQIFKSWTKEKIVLPFNKLLNIIVYTCDVPITSTTTITWNGKSIIAVSNVFDETIKTTFMPEIETNHGFGMRFGSQQDYAITFWVENRNDDIEFLGSVNKEEFTQTTFLPPELKVVTNLNNPIVTATISEFKNTTKTTIVALRKSNSEGIGTVFKNTYSIYFVDFADVPATYSVIYQATDNLDPKKRTYMIRSEAFFNSNITVSDVYNCPPKRVTDFRAINIDRDGEVTFQWTAPGRCLDTGTASVYYIRCHYNMDSKNDIEEYAIMNRAPLEAGNTEIYQWMEDPNYDKYDVYYCTIRADAYKMSEPSNVVIINMEQINDDPDTTRNPTSFITPTSGRFTTEESSYWYLPSHTSVWPSIAITGIVISSFLIISLLIVLCCKKRAGTCFKRFKSKHSTTNARPGNNLEETNYHSNSSTLNQNINRITNQEQHYNSLYPTLPSEDRLTTITNTRIQATSTENSNVNSEHQQQSSTSIPQELPPSYIDVIRESRAY